ncbi:MAG: hypothetical protein HY505_00670 [Candidatus Yanofskybacteria bacterium]|nr:hypothetical protein [Candidatus Yanofskybacteria bacterium]
MEKESVPTTLNSGVKLEEELEEIVNKERKEVRREKFDLSSTRVVLEKLEREGLIKPQDTLREIKKVIEEEAHRIEDI